MAFAATGKLRRAVHELVDPKTAAGFWRRRRRGTSRVTRLSRASLIALVRPRRAPSGRCVRSTVTRRRLRPASASRSGSDRRQLRVTGVWRRPDRPLEDVEPPMDDSLASTPGERPHGDRAAPAGSGTPGPRALQARRVGIARCALFPRRPGRIAGSPAPPIKTRGRRLPSRGEVGQSRQAAGLHGHRHRNGRQLRIKNVIVAGTNDRDKERRARPENRTLRAPTSPTVAAAGAPARLA